MNNIQLSLELDLLIITLRGMSCFTSKRWVPNLLRAFLLIIFRISSFFITILWQRRRNCKISSLDSHDSFPVQTRNLSDVWDELVFGLWIEMLRKHRCIRKTKPAVNKVIASNILTTNDPPTHEKKMAIVISIISKPYLW